ncbi:hypothetical protein UCRPC4_g02345 [Phaeomoniella chlamydospora]|uniref:Uncharacterized protein n=1 Tax=Phaeomoniella chlamydospora TaxID=158046 RepID=A0A0G2H830_PHACM|nr:hypothetical protein UCRPC4_g02345 [Phaeomoniella chlamydospora]
MKEPFQLVLPAAPPSPPSSPIENRPRLSKRPLMIRQHSADDTVHTISRKQDFEGQSKTEPVRMLKMTPLSFPDLKASASTTHLQVCKHAPSLLPSPDFNDSTIVATSNKSHFSFHDPRTAPGNGLSPYESHSIVSSYCETAEGQDHVSAQATGGLDFDQDERQIHSDTELDVPRTGKAIVKFEKPGHRKRSSTFSSEGDWLKGTMRYCEDWLRGVDADPRRCQIVQDPDSEVNSIVGDQSTPVKYVTVIQTTKPKLVTISRPSSMWTIPPGDVVPEEPPRPQTPQSACREVSAFSPWDSPKRDSVTTSRTITGVGHSPTTQTPGTSPRRESMSRIPLPSSIAPLRFTHIRRSSSRYSPSSQVSTPSPKESEFSLASSHTTATSILPSANLIQSISHYKVEEQQPVISSHSSTFERDLCDENNDLEWLLSHLSNEIDAYPTSILHLDSPLILQMRPANSLDEILISVLRKIFPQTAPLFLSALAAAIIAHCYILNIANPPLATLPIPPPPVPPISVARSRKPKSPDAASANSSFAQRVANFSTSSSASSLSTPSMIINTHQSAHTQVSNLEDIPAKARATLGLNNDHDLISHKNNMSLATSNPIAISSPSPALCHRTSLQNRAEILGIELDLIVNDLLRSICGRGNDAVLKTSLRVLIGVVESSEDTGGGLGTGFL